MLKGVIHLEFTVNTDVLSKQNILICFWCSVFSKSFSSHLVSPMNGFVEEESHSLGTWLSLRTLLEFYSQVLHGMGEQHDLNSALPLLYSVVHPQELVVRSSFIKANCCLGWFELSELLRVSNGEKPSSNVSVQEKGKKKSVMHRNMHSMWNEILPFNTVILEDLILEM